MVVIVMVCVCVCVFCVLEIIWTRVAQGYKRNRGAQHCGERDDFP